MATPPTLQKPPMAPTGKLLNRVASAVPAKAAMTTEEVVEMLKETEQENVHNPRQIAQAKPIVIKGNPTFDYAAYKAKSIARGPAKPKPLMMLLTGRRSAGKSFCLGSAPGDMILFCSRQEHHSLQAALSCNKMLRSQHSITEVWMDMDDEGNLIDNPDKVWDRTLDKLESLINTPNVAELFPFLAFDGLNSIERYVGRLKRVESATQFQKNAVSTATLIELIVDKFLRLREKGVHIICTMASEVKERPDGSLSLVPMMTGYRAADEILGSFPDIAVATVVQAEEGDEIKDVHVFQFRNAEGIKTGKKFSGETATTTFSPRLQSIPRDKLPVYLDANIGGLIDFVNQTFESLSTPDVVIEE
jgi:hypothetical protein